MIDPTVLLASAAAVFGLLSVLWLVSLARRDASIVDIGWGPAFVVIAAVSSGTAQSDGVRGQLVLALVALWGIRLGVYLAWRNLGHGEDFRYQKMRAHWGERFWWVSLFTVFLLQASLAWIVSLPVQLAIASPLPERLGWLDGLGAAVFLAGFLFESVGDWQLARFKADPASRGKVLDSGLWGWTRHPNYFGDFLVWWGLFLIALATPQGYFALIGPMIMSWLLMRVSGVPMLERSLRRHRPGYDDYRRRVSAFFPRPPRRSSLES